MPAKKQTTHFYGRLSIILLFCFAGADLVLFYILPLDILYPFTFNAPSEQLKMAAILFNDFNETFTGVSKETKRRLNHGLTMLEKNRVEQLIVVGGNREESQRKGAQLMADYLLESGVSKEKILLEKTSSDSISNLEKLSMIMVKQGVDSVTLISSPYHLWRIRSMNMPSKTKFSYFPYSPTDCIPPLSRWEIWLSAHYNLTAYFLHALLPQSAYRNFVRWVRKNTDW